MTVRLYEDSVWNQLIGATITVLKDRGVHTFANKDLYEFGPIFGVVFPDNRHIEQKICETLQQLCVTGEVKRLKRGRYVIK